MSLVGTRPILPDELEQYEMHHRARIAIKPGITGMWQVSGRSDITDFEEIVRLDTEYTKIRYLTDFIRTFSDSYEITISEIAENLLEDYKWCFRRIICNNRFSEAKEIIEEIVESNIWNGLFENVKTYEFENKLLLKKYIKIYLIITRLKHYLRIIKKRLNSNILSFKIQWGGGL